MNARAYTEEEIQDLTDRVFLLRQQLEAGKIHFAAHLVEDFHRSYESIKLRPDGLVDPTTVDGRIRAATLAVRVMKQRDEAKKIGQPWRHSRSLFHTAVSSVWMAP